MTVIDGDTTPDPLRSITDAADDFSIRLRAYAPNGGSLGFLPEPLNIQVSYPLSDLPALKFEYRKDGINAELLLRDEGLEIATELYAPRAGTWFEPISGRFVVLDWQEDVADPSGVITVTAPGYAWLLSKVAVHKRKQDDRLRIAEEDAIEAEREAEREYNSAQSKLNSIITRLRNDNQLSGASYVMNLLPRVINGEFPPHGSAIFRPRTATFHGYNANTRRWSTRVIPNETAIEARDAYDEAKRLRDAYREAKHRAERATWHAREATKNNKRPMLQVTAGEVMTRLVAESRTRTRGRLNGMGFNFNGTYSSASDGTPADHSGTRVTRRKWSSQFDLELTIGQSYLDVLESLTEMGEVEWFFKGRDLHMYRPGDLGVRLGDSAALHLGLDMTEAPDRATRRDFANYLLVRGEGHTSFGMWNDQRVQQTGWGVWEEAVSISGVEGTSELKRAALKEARDSLRRIKVESTRDINLSGPSRYRPMYDYLPGQYISAYGSDGTMQSLRIMGITLTFDIEQGISGHITLGDRFMQQAINFRKTIARTVGGYEKVIGGGTVPTLPANPGAPEGEEEALMPPALLVATTRAGVNRLNGQPSTIVNLAWQTLETPRNVEYEDDPDEG